MSTSQAHVDLSSFSLSDMIACGREIRAAAGGSHGLDAASRHVVDWLYDHLRTADGQRACVLVRYFQTQPFESLDPEQRDFALAQLGDGVTHPGMKCLTLRATVGDEDAWNDPADSESHRVLPLPSEQMVATSPMISRLMRQFGVNVAALTTGDPAPTPPDGVVAYNVFHVEDARGSPYVPAQESFVEPYGIRSVLGFGALLPTGELFAVILFLRVRVPAEIANLFQTLALNVKVAILPHVTSGDTEGYIDATEAQRAALEELLAVTEHVVEDQSQDLEQRGRRLRSLNEAAMEVHAAREVDEVLERIVEQARSLIGAHQAVASLTIDHNWAQAVTAVSLSEKYGAYRDYAEPPDGSGIYAEVCRTNQPMRLTQEELESHPAWQGFGPHADEHPPMRGWLAAPLVARDGSNLGIIQLSDRYEGEFTEDDEQTVVQLARIGSLALENARLADLEALQEGERFRQELLAGLSHDMKTPVVSVVGLAEALLEEGPDMPPDERTTVHEAVLRQARALQGLVSQFLDYTRLEAGRELALAPRPMRLAPVVEEAAALFSHARTIELDALTGLPSVEADPDRVRQIVANLLSNAVKFSPSDTTVSVLGEFDDEEVTLWVVDRGEGLEPDEAMYLFEKFYRGQNTGNVSGSGLGLYISGTLANAMGGRMLVETAPGEGSRFGLVLPRARADGQ